jgi:hypothetical protein
MVNIRIKFNKNVKGRGTPDCAEKGEDNLR